MYELISSHNKIETKNRIRKINNIKLFSINFNKYSYFK